MHFISSQSRPLTKGIFDLILLIMLTLIIMIIILGSKLRLKIPLQYIRRKCDNNRCKINVIVEYFVSRLLIWSHKSKLITDYHMIPLFCIPFRIAGLTTSYVWGGTKCKHSIYTIVSLYFDCFLTNSSGVVLHFVNSTFKDICDL